MEYFSKLFQQYSQQFIQRKLSSKLTDIQIYFFLRILSLLSIFTRTIWKMFYKNYHWLNWYKSLMYLNTGWKSELSSLKNACVWVWCGFFCSWCSLFLQLLLLWKWMQRNNYQMQKIKFSSDKSMICWCNSLNYLDD